MSLWRGLGLILTLGAVLLNSGCCCCCSPDALPTEPFTPGDFPDIPPYPGAEQQTGRDPAFGLVTIPFQLVTDEAEWKHYVTGDPKDEVLDWYAAQMADLGWTAVDVTEVQMPTEDALLFAWPDDPGVTAVVMLLPDPQEQDRQHILIGRLRLPLEE
ncbi:MAG TPA: hypothetical protein EYP77_00855 [Anaerolineae bacterium]|nr:hypothetical protein [Anaerolineae bacterium]